MSVAGVPAGGTVSAYAAVFTAIAVGGNRDAARLLRDLSPENLAELHVICGDVQIMVEADQRRREEPEDRDERVL